MPDKNKQRDIFNSYISLVERCKRQERAAQRELFERLSVKMFPVCLRYVGDREKAKDVLQDGFITLFAKLEDYRGDGFFEGWARRIFVTAALMYLRKTDVLRQAAQIDNEALQAEPLLKLEQEETAHLDADRIMELIMSMPAGFRTVFNLYAIEGFSHKEIAEMLNLSEGGSRSQLSRARAWLQERLKQKK